MVWDGEIWDSGFWDEFGIFQVLPTLIIEMDLGDPATTPTWAADLTPYTRAWSSRRGSQRELQRVEAGTAVLALDNRDGRFTPQSTTSVYYPNLLPMRRIRIRADFGGEIYSIFSGYVESWPAIFPGIVDQVVQVSLVDGFKWLALAKVTGSFSQQGSGARVSAILDNVGWPAADRTIATGQSTVPAITLTNVSALEHLQAIEHAEGGRLFMGRDGKVNFVGRFDSLTTPNFAGRTWTDDGTGMNYRDIVLAFNDELIVNDARLTRTGGTQQVAQSSASITRFRTRSLVESDIQLVTDNEVSDLGQELVGKYAEPALRIEGLADNAMRHGRWDQLLIRELRDRVLIVKTPVGASTLSQDSYLEGISHDWQPGEWRTNLNVTPANAEAVWVLDDDNLSILDSTTILGR